jgi:hypothetical protein
MCLSESHKKPSGGVAQADGGVANPDAASNCSGSRVFLEVLCSVQHEEQQYLRCAVLFAVFLHQCLGSRSTEGAHLRSQEFLLLSLSMQHLPCIEKPQMVTKLWHPSLPVHAAYLASLVYLLITLHLVFLCLSLLCIDQCSFFLAAF